MAQIFTFCALCSLKSSDFTLLIVSLFLSIIYLLILTTYNKVPIFEFHLQDLHRQEDQRPDLSFKCVIQFPIVFVMEEKICGRVGLECNMIQLIDVQKIGLL